MEKNQQPKLIAYTDASLSAEGEGTSTILFFHQKRDLLHSAVTMNFGRRGAFITKLELDTKIAALHLAPFKVAAVMSDSESTVRMLNNYTYHGKTSGLNKFLDANEFKKLDADLKRHPRVQFHYAHDSKPKMRLADQFSRLAKGKAFGIEVREAPQDLRFREQQEYLLNSFQ